MRLLPVAVLDLWVAEFGQRANLSYVGFLRNGSKTMRGREKSPGDYL